MPHGRANIKVNIWARTDSRRLSKSAHTPVVYYAAGIVCLALDSETFGPLDDGFRVDVRHV